MSKDILGSLLRVLVTVPEDRLGLVQDVCLKLSNDDGEHWKQPLKQFLRKETCWAKPVSLAVSEADSMNIMVWLDKWPEFCKQFGLAIEVDFAALKKSAQIVNRAKGFDWIVYCPKGFTTSEALELCRKQGFNVYEEISVDQYSLERKPDATDLLLCRATIEPDNEWLGKSADDMSTTKTPFLDARERYMLEAFYFWLTGKHLDINGWTRCPRSRTSGDGVASASWGGGRFEAFWSVAGRRGDGAGGREAVILKP